MAKPKSGGERASSFDRVWLEATADDARARVDEARERGAELVEGWVAHKNAAAVAEIAADDGAPGPARKAARRGINVLKSRGVPIPPRGGSVEVSTSAVETREAWFRPPDGAGTSAFTVAARAGQGRYRLVDVIVRQGVGLSSIAGMEMSRSQLRTTFDGIRERFGYAPVPVPVDWTRGRIKMALDDNEKSHTPVPLGFDTYSDLLAPAPSVAPRHPAEASTLPEVDLADALARSAKLHAEPELRGWLPDPAAMERMLLAVGQSVRGEPGSDPKAAETKVREILEQATDAFFTAEKRSDVARSMKDAAISVAVRGAPDRAAELLATAGEIATLAGPPRAIPFLRAFFEKAFGLLTARAAARKGG